MNLSTRIASAALVLSLLAPIGANAATPSTPKALRFRDIVKLIEANATKNVSFDGTATVTSGKNKAKMSITSVQNSQFDSVKKFAADMTMVADASLEDGTDVHGVVRIRAVDGTLYLRLDDLRITGPLSIYAGVLEPYADTWISAPIEDNVFMEKSGGKPPITIGRLEQFLSVQAEATRDGARYTVTLPRAKMRRFLLTLMRSTNSAGLSMTDIRRAIRLTTVDFTMVMDVQNDTLQKMTNDVRIATTYEGQKVNAILKGVTTRLASAPAIVAPADSVTMDELFGIGEGAGWNAVDDAESRNAQRRSDANMILAAVYQYAIDHDGHVPVIDGYGFPETPVCATWKTCDGVSFDDALIGTYLVKIPVDPSQDSDSPFSGYVISTGANGRITVSAPLAEDGASISVTK